MAETLSREGGRIPPPLRGPPPFGKGGNNRRGRVLVRGQRQTEARLKQYKNSLQDGRSF